MFETDKNPHFEWLDGRRRVAGVPYMLPNDLEETNRLDFQHYLLRYAMNALYVAPITQPRRILDIASGTGRWLIEMARLFPQATLTGLDLAIPDPEQVTSVPLNCRFKQGDVTHGLPFADASFDFVHQRLLALGLMEDAWLPLLKDIYRVTRPGGWIELVEVNLHGQRLGPQGQRLSQVAEDLARQRGIDPFIQLKLEDSLKAANFTNIGTNVFSVPVGNWGGHLGNMMAKNMVSVIRAARPLIVKYTDFPGDEYDQIVNTTLLQEFEQYQTFTNFYLSYGQRPQSAG